MRSLVTSALLAAIFTCSLAAAAERPNLLEALEAQRLLAQQSPTVSVLNDLGNLMVLAGLSNEAESTYRRVLIIDAGNVPAQFNLGLLLQYRGDADAARNLFLEVISIQPIHAWAHYQLGALHEAAGARAEAIDSYARALAIDPELYFPDVNPQIVTNTLVTESLIEAASLRRPSALAPMSFVQPRKITQLLLSLPSAPVDDQPDDQQP
jgi:tetratricopeptide (TPR) repeat protein